MAFSCQFFHISLKKKRTQNHPQCLSGLSRALFLTTFLEKALYSWTSLQRPPWVQKKAEAVSGDSRVYFLKFTGSPWRESSLDHNRCSTSFGKSHDILEMRLRILLRKFAAVFKRLLKKLYCTEGLDDNWRKPLVTIFEKPVWSDLYFLTN